MILHHTFGNGDFGVFRQVAEQITVAQADLCEPTTTIKEIDRVLRECWIQSRPVYIQLPTDMVDKLVDGTTLDTLDLSYPKNNKEEEDEVVGRILHRLYRTQCAVLLIDGAVRRTRVSPIQVHQVKKHLLTCTSVDLYDRNTDWKVQTPDLCCPNGQRFG